MIEKIKKNKKIIMDLFFNTFGFGIYIIAQQIVLLPIMAKVFNENDFSKIVLYVSVFAIITNVLGSELGIVRQVKRDEENNSGNYNRILLQLIPFIIIVSSISLVALGFSLIEIVLLTITILLGNVRLYASAFFRNNKDFKNIVIQNIIYLIGVVLGIIIIYKIKLIWIPMLVAEVLCLIFNIIKTDVFKVKPIKTDENKNIWKTFRDFGIISFLVNMTTYFDKIIIYPILGESAVSVYYSTSSMSKVLALITNPMHGVILSWIKGNDENFKKKITRMTLKVNIPIIIITFIIGLPITYLAVMILYPQYLNSALPLILPVTIAMAFNTVSTIVKAILLKYIDSKKLVKEYVIYIGILIVLAIVMSNLFGIVGFAYATAISKIALWFMFILNLNKIGKYNIQKQGEKSEEK